MDAPPYGSPDPPQTTTQIIQKQPPPAAPPSWGVPIPPLLTLEGECTADSGG